MASKMNMDSLVEAFSDTKVVSALADALTPLFTSMTNALDKRIDTLILSINELKLNNKLLRDQAESVKEENVTLRKQLAEQSDRIDQLEGYTRSDNLIIKGLPEKFMIVTVWWKRRSSLSVGSCSKSISRYKTSRWHIV